MGKVSQSVQSVQSVILRDPSLEFVKSLLLEAGNNIGSVHFLKRSDNSLRKMTYRLHVQKPSVASIPGKDGKDGKEGKVGKKLDRKVINKANNQLTVLDTNKVVRDSSGNIIGRGAWRTIPLDRVVRVANKGIIYFIERDKD